MVSGRERGTFSARCSLYGTVLGRPREINPRESCFYNARTLATRGIYPVWSQFQGAAPAAGDTHCARTPPSFAPRLLCCPLAVVRATIPVTTGLLGLNITAAGPLSHDRSFLAPPLDAHTILLHATQRTLVMGAGRNNRRCRHRDAMIGELSGGTVMWIESNKGCTDCTRLQQTLRQCMRAKKGSMLPLLCTPPRVHHTPWPGPTVVACGGFSRCGSGHPKKRRCCSLSTSKQIAVRPPQLCAAVQLLALQNPFSPHRHTCTTHESKHGKCRN